MGLFQELRVKLGLSTTGFEAGINRAQMAGARFSQNIKGQLGAAFSAGAVALATKKLIDYGSKISDLSKKVGVGTEALQEFDYAAKKNGATLEDVAAAFRGLAKARKEALGGDAEKLKVFEALGIDKEALTLDPLEKTFRKIADSFNKMDFGNDELTMVEAVLGKMAGSLLPTFKDGLAEAVDEAKQLGIALSDDVVQALDKAGDEADKFFARLRKPGAEATSRVLKVASGIMDALEGLSAASMGFLGGAWKTEGGLKEKFGGGVREAVEQLREVMTDPVNAAIGAAARGDAEGNRVKKPSPFTPIEHVINAVTTGGFNVQTQGDALARIGGFTGAAGNVNSMVAEMVKSLNVMQKDLAAVRQQVNSAMLS